MNYTIVFAALMGAQAMQLKDGEGLVKDRFDTLYEDQMSDFIKKEAAESQ